MLVLRKVDSRSQKCLFMHLNHAEKCALETGFRFVLLSYTFIAIMTFAWNGFVYCSRRTLQEVSLNGFLGSGWQTQRTTQPQLFLTFRPYTVVVAQSLSVDDEANLKRLTL